MGQAYLRRLAAEPITDDNHLAIASRLRQELDPGQTHAVLETALLRQRARDKFSRAAEMYFTRAALEQASSEPVSRYRASRIGRAGYDTVADLGCGVGGDALALAAQHRVLGLDRSWQRLAMARENVRVYGHQRRFQPLLADLNRFPPLPVDAFFADPSRRDARGRRAFAPHDYRPPLNSLLSCWLPRVPHAVVKVSPGIDYAHLPPNAGLEFISLHGEVKEAALWFGDLRDGSQRRATLLPGGDTLSDLDRSDAPVTTSGPLAFLYEPDGAVIRAHLVETLAQRLGAYKIDDDIAYLTARHARQTPFARCFAIEEAMPFHLKRLRARLRALDVGRVTVKKRGSPLSPRELRQRLDLRGERHVIVFLTHVQGAPFILIAEEV
jgi:SAM-dependent methyltransferase